MVGCVKNRKGRILAGWKHRSYETMGEKPGQNLKVPGLAVKAEGPQSARQPSEENYPEPYPREKGDRTELRARTADQAYRRMNPQRINFSILDSIHYPKGMLELPPWVL